MKTGQTVIPLVKGTVFFVIYLITALWGLHMNAVSGFASLIWLPTGISLFALFFLGIDYWPAVFLGAFLTNALTGAPFVVAFSIGVGNTLEAVIGVYLLKRFRFRSQMDQLRDVYVIIFFAALLSTLLSATIGVVSLLLGRVITLPAVFSTWFAWWVGDVISDLIIAPLLFVWASKPQLRLSRMQIAECVSMVLVLGVISFTVFYAVNGSTPPLTYLVFPPLIWASLRFSSREAISAIFLLSLFTIGSIIKSIGPFARPTMSESLLYVQSFMTIIAITTMLLAAAMSERRQLQKKKDEFIAIASHELKTPLTSIKAFAQVLQRRFENRGDAEASDYLSRINGQINKLSRLVRELLDIGKIQEGKMFLHTERFNIQTLLQEVIADMSRTTPQRILLKNPQKVVIVADRDRIGQVLTNLLANAIKFSPRAKAVIVTLKKEPTDVTISIRDFGIGIAPADKERIFDRFYQAKNDSGRENNQEFGLGLGLYIVKGIISAHDGKIWIESPKRSSSRIRGKRTKKEAGCIFFFSLPITEK